MKKIFSHSLGILFCIFYLSHTASAQYFSTGADPGSLKWRQINTENFQLIYPDHYEEQAKHLAALFEEVYAYGYHTLGQAPNKISVILHTETVNSNGMVAWTPKRMELYTTPHQQIYPQDWLQQLAVHEFRHVVQMDKIQRELPFIFKLILGEHAASAAVAAYVPFWYLEGDAVVTETALTSTGRGRNPVFLMENKAQLLEKGSFPYDKASLGSYRDFVPDRYKFGWWMVGGIRDNYGAAVWDKAISRVAQKPWSINPINKVLKAETGKTKEEIYADLFDEYRIKWQAEIDSLNLSPLEEIVREAPGFTSFLYLDALGDGSLIAYKTRRDDIGRIVRIVDRKESTLYTPGTILTNSLSAQNMQVIWSERRRDLRWEHADRSVIIILDVVTGKTRQFNFSRNLFAPVIDPSGKWFAAVAVDNSNNYALQVYDLQNGELISSFQTDSNDFLFNPCWSADSESLYFIGLNASGKYLAELKRQTKTSKQLTQPSFADIRNLSLNSGLLYFTSAQTGIDNIFQLDPNTRKLTQLTSVPFGADYAHRIGDKLYFSNYTSDGYQLVRLAANDFVNQDSEMPSLASNPLADKLVDQEIGQIDFESVDTTTYQSERYSKLANLFNFHSWAPAYINANDYELRPGVTFLSQNKLGTAFTVLGYEYDMTERVGKYKVNFEYRGAFPTFDSEFAYGKRKANYLEIQQNGDTVARKFDWNELEVNLGMSIPLTFSSGKYTQYLRPTASYNFYQIDHTANTPSEFFEGHYHSAEFQLNAQNILRRSELDLQPKWGQMIQFDFKKGLAGDLDIGNLAAVQSVLYFPGFYKNHGIRLYNGYEQKDTDRDLAFSGVVRFPRGISRISYTNLYTFGGDYVMPLWYPDLSIWRLFYMTRLRASFFYDFSSFKGETYNQDGSVYSIYEKYLSSIGTEVRVDGHVLRLIAPATFGIRSMYLPDFKEVRFEFLLSISIDAF